MSTPKYIEDFEKQMKDRHNGRVQQQMTDEEFLKNEYPLTLIKKSDYQMRTNFAVRMINAITQQLISNAPKVYVQPNTNTDVAKDSAKGTSIIFNRWIDSLKKQPSNPFEQSFKNLNFRGEAWLYIPHNDALIKLDKDIYGNALPVHFILYDPMVIFSEPNEEIDGEPDRVLIKYEQNISYVQKIYPMWSNPQKLGEKKRCKYLFYFDRKKSYAEADNEPLFRYKDGKNKGKFMNGTGERDNLYGCVPFVHMYSGWGFENQKRDPEMLAYSRIRMIRDLITEDSQVRSDSLYNFHSSAFQSKTLFVPAGSQVPDDWSAAFKNEPDKLNLIILPESATPDWFKKEETQLFGAEAWAYADRIRADLGMEYPAPLRGATGTSSGREADILGGNALALYDCAVEATSLLWAKGLLKGTKVASSVDLLPDGITDSDLKRIEDVIVDLRSDDPVARDRQITMGRVLVNEGKRSLKRFLMEDMRMTEKEADNEIDDILMEKIMLQSPEIAAFLGFKAAEKSGMADELKAYREMTAGRKEKPIELGSTTGSRGGEPRTLNIKTPTGAEQTDVALTAGGQRSTPMR